MVCVEFGIWFFLSQQTSGARIVVLNMLESSTREIFCIVSTVDWKIFLLKTFSCVTYSCYSIFIIEHTGQSYAASAMATVLCVHIILLQRGNPVALSPMMPNPGHFLPPSTAVWHVPVVITLLTQIGGIQYWRYLNQDQVFVNHYITIKWGPSQCNYPAKKILANGWL